MTDRDAENTMTTFTNAGRFYTDELFKEAKCTVLEHVYDWICMCGVCNFEE